MSDSGVTSPSSRFDPSTGEDASRLSELRTVEEQLRRSIADLTQRQRVAEEAQARREREVALRANVTELLAQADSLRPMLQGCAEALVAHLRAAFARIWTLSPGSSVLTLQASAGLYTHIDGAHARVAVGEFKIGLIALERVPHVTNNVPGDSRIHDQPWAKREGLVAFAGYPLIVERRVVGVMALFAADPLAEETLETLGSVAASVAQGIERIRSEERLRRSEAYLAEGQRLSHTGSWAWNLHTGERFWTREVFRIYGFEPADGPPPYSAVRERVHPRDVSIVDRVIAEALRTGNEFRFEVRILIPGESVKWVETVGHPVRDEDGHVVEFIGTDIDITQRRRAHRRLRREIQARFEAVLGERTRIAREMHDGLLQELSGIALQLRALLPRVRSTPQEAASTLERIMAMTEHASREARRAVVGMRPSSDSGDVVSAVERAAHRVCDHAPLALSFIVKGQVRPVPSALRDAAVMIVQEAATNVVKHAHAQSIAVSVSFRRHNLRVVIRDDGHGFSQIEPDTTAATGHFGVIGMRERALEAGATFGIRSAPGRGTVVRLNVPLGA